MTGKGIGFAVVALAALGIAACGGPAGKPVADKIVPIPVKDDDTPIKIPEDTSVGVVEVVDKPDTSGPPPADLTKRLAYYKAKADGGSADAAYELGQMYLKGKGPTRKPDPAAARPWFEKAADAKHADATAMLGQMAFEGVGYPSRDFEEAILLWTRASDLGSAEAAVKLGILYHRGYKLTATGKVVAGDAGAARKWYELAAEKDDPRALNNLGWMWLEGELGTKGSEANRGTAERYFTRAAKLGSEGAKNGLKQLAGGTAPVPDPTPVSPKPVTPKPADPPVAERAAKRKQLEKELVGLEAELPAAMARDDATRKENDRRRKEHEDAVASGDKAIKDAQAKKNTALALALILAKTQLKAPEELPATDANGVRSRIADVKRQLIDLKD